ncbi:unnamed protein product [Pedinophyceae sp. YPF-701]|nr:unnamed protein product [Pedinophyceae sp. YPF-701]
MSDDVSGGSGAPGRQEKARPSFTDILDAVPHILHSLPAASSLNLASTCWASLMALMRHGRRGIPGEVEWRAAESGTASSADHRLVVVADEQLLTPVIRISRLHGALMCGISVHVDESTPYVGKLDFSVARFDVAQANILHDAATRAKLRDDDVATEYARVGALDRILRLPARRGMALHVRRVDVPARLLIETQAGPGDQDSVSASIANRLDVVCAVLAAPAVYRHVEHLVLRRITVASSLLRILAALPELQHVCTLDVSGGAIDTAAALALARLVEACPTLRHLDVSRVTGFTEAGMAAVAKEVFRKRKDQRMLTFDCGFVDYNDCVAAAMLRYGGGRLERLGLERRPGSIGPQSGLVRKIAASTHRLADLRLGIASHLPEDLRALVATSTTLRALDLSGSCIRDGSLERLCQTIASTPDLRLERLRLDGLKMTDRGGKAVARMLAETPSLRALSLRDNRLRDDAAKRLAKALGRNRTLRELDLSLNDVAVSGFKRLLSAVGNSAALEHFAIEGNRFGTDGDAKLGALGPALRSLRLGAAGPQGSSARLTGLYAFATQLAGNLTLRVLSLRGFRMDGDRAGMIARAVRENSTLRSLSLDEARLGDVCGRDLANEVSHNHGLQHLSLRGNPAANSETAAALCRALDGHPTLERVDVDGCGFAGGAFWRDRVRQARGPCPRVVVIGEGSEVDES